MNLLHHVLERRIQDMPARQITRITGYSTRTIRHWCTQSRLRAFSHQHTYKVPKEWLLELLTSEDYNSITRKSKKHYAIIAAVGTKHKQLENKGRTIEQGAFPTWKRPLLLNSIYRNTFD